MGWRRRGSRWRGPPPLCLPALSARFAFPHSPPAVPSRTPRARCVSSGQVRQPAQLAARDGAREPLAGVAAATRAAGGE
eukprot:4709914-Prymnesium_polylepis.1